VANETAGERVRVCRFDDIADGTALLVSAKQRKIVLARIGDEVFALQDACPHKGGALHEGKVHTGRCEVICPLHFFRFDVRTGASITNPELVAPTFPVTISEGDVYVHVARPAAKPAIAESFA
jgi:3-phenylpropionate/trans-cinnamate dioxygenase ferredoxin component